MEHNLSPMHRQPWNKGKIVGQKAPLKLRDISALRVRLQLANRVRELALFHLGIDSKLRGCDLVELRVCDVCHGGQVAARAIVMQQKTQRPVQFEITRTTPTRFRPGSSTLVCGRMTSSFRAGYTGHHTWERGSTPAS
jgi:hypothetical protein